MSHFQPLGVKGIDHITIVAQDLDKSVEFYVGLLGMKHIGRPDFGFPGHWFQAGSTQIHLNQQGVEAGLAGMPISTATEIARAFHYAFVVDDCDATAKQLRQQGVQIVEGPRTRPDGARQLYLRDPDQHLVELFSVPQQQESGHES